MFSLFWHADLSPKPARASANKTCLVSDPLWVHRQNYRAFAASSPRKTQKVLISGLNLKVSWLALLGVSKAFFCLPPTRVSLVNICGQKIGFDHTNGLVNFTNVE